MPAGYSGTPLPKKLGIKPGARVGTIRAPRNLPALLADLPPGVRLVRLRAGARACSVILCFTPDLKSLHSQFERAVDALDVNGGLWIAWPKRSSAMASDILEADVRRVGLATGLVDNKICAIDDDWSGLRFVVRVSDRARWSDEWQARRGPRPPAPSS